MTTFCRIVLTLVSCSVDPQTPRPSPAEAAQVLTASVPPAAPAWRLEALDVGWGAVPPPPRDPAWPFSGTFRPTWAPPLRTVPEVEVYLPLGYGLQNRRPFYYNGRYDTTRRAADQGAYGRPGRAPLADVRGVDRHDVYGAGRSGRAVGAVGGSVPARGVPAWARPADPVRGTPR